MPVPQVRNRALYCCEGDLKFSLTYVIAYIYIFSLIQVFTTDLSDEPKRNKGSYSIYDKNIPPAMTRIARYCVLFG